MGTEKRTLKTVGRSIDLLRHIQRVDGARVTELADAFDLAPSTIHGYLKTLEEKEMVVKEGDIYHLGLRFLEMGRYTQHRTEARELAEEYTKKLVEETGYRAEFVTEEHGKCIFVHKFSGSQPSWEHEEPGQHAPLHCLATGKAILAELPEPIARERLTAQGLEARTEKTITNIEPLLDELKEIRQNGFALNDCENIQGVRAVGVPAKDTAGNVIGAFSVSGPKHSMTGETFREDLPRAVKEIVNEFELELTL
ncbi:IclR family transcriptional regulator [Haloterrigena turkmenica]